MMVAGIVALTGAAYFLVSNKNDKKIVLMVGLVLSGAVAATSVVSADEKQSEMNCYRYVGFIHESGETTTESTTTTTTTTTTEESTTEAPTPGTTSSAPQVVAPNDHL